MTVTYRGAVAIIQLVAYVPSLVIASILAFRHVPQGFARSSSWLHVISFTLLRIIGAICELIAMSKPSEGVVITAVVCSFIGLAPLVLLCLGLLARVYVSRPSPRTPNNLTRRVATASPRIRLILLSSKE